jgi:CHAT domain-containing protein/tetratricopeptide (TPR) repeat protein
MKKIIPISVLSALLLMANAANSEDLYSKLQELQQALALKPNDGKLLHDTGYALYQAGSYAEAEPLLQRSLTTREKLLGSNHPDVAESLNSLALLYVTLGKYTAAEPLFLRSLAIREKVLGKNHLDVAMTLNDLGSLYYDQGKYEKVEPLFQRSLAIEEQALGKNHPRVSTRLNNLAVLYVAQSKYEQAEPLLQRSLEINVNAYGNNHPSVAISLNNIAELYQRQGKYEKIERLYLRSLAIWENSLGKNHPDVAVALNNLAILYEKQKNYAQAESFYQRSLAIRSQAFGDEHPAVSESLNNLAALYQMQNQPEKARPLYERSLAIRKKVFGEDHLSVAANLNNLAELYREQGQYQQAEPLYKNSLAILERNLGKDHFEVTKSLNNIAWLYIGQEKYPEADSVLQRSLKISNQFLERWLWGAGEQTRQAYLQQEEYNRSVFLTFHTFRNSADQVLYFSLARKGLLLRIASEISSLAKQSTDPGIQKQIQDFNALKTQLSTFMLSSNFDKDAVQNLQIQSNILEMQLSQKVSAFKRHTTEVTVPQVLNKLTAHQGLVDFLIFKTVDLKTTKYQSEQVIALVADKQNGVKLINLGELTPISDAVKTYRQTVLPMADGQLAKREEILKPNSQKLYDLIWQPLLPYLADKKQVYLIPDGILHLLPFKALIDKQGHYLAENYQITLLSSARDIVLPPVSKTGKEAVIFAAPDFGGQQDKVKQPNRNIATRLQDIYFAPLTGAAAEGKALSDLIKAKQPVKFFQDQQASETKVVTLKSPKLLHFATHGFFLENLSLSGASNERTALMQDSGFNAFQNAENSLTRSGLALTGANSGINGRKQADGTDGILTALEVLALNLEGTDLVTLSACETGVGDIQVGEGVYSLNRAFQEAGAKAVLSTLWSVADEQTKLFMQEFYTLVLNGDSPQQALQKTQLKFINDKNTQDPFFWAAFTVVGI